MQKTKLSSFILLLLFVLFWGCGKDSTPTGPEQPTHIEAAGCVIQQGETEIARAEKNAVSGQFILEERVQSPLLGFYLIADDGKLFRPDSEEYIFAWKSKKPQVADAIQFETDGDWNFHIKGFEAGQTSIEFKVLHGDHEDFVSLEIPVQITASAGGGLGK